MTPELQKLTCSFCKTEKNTSEFSKSAWSKTGFYKHCRKCHYTEYGRGAAFKRNYGITEFQYKQMLEKQNYRCLACFSLHEPEKGVSNRLVVDHCHSKGNVRGLLCQGCNLALGGSKDDPNTLRNLADYLENNNAFN